MKKFILLYKGPATPPNASHEGWPEWFQKAGDALVDRGSGMVNGMAIHSDGSSSAPTVTLNGYSIVQAEDSDGLRALVEDHPYLKLGNNYTIEAFEVPAK